MKIRDIRNGMIFIYKGIVLQDISFEHTPAQTVKIYARNLLLDEMENYEIGAEEEIDASKIEECDVIFGMFSDVEALFLNEDTNEGYFADESILPLHFEYVQEDCPCTLILREGEPIGVRIPRYVTAKVESVEDGMATLANGAKIAVPDKISAGDEIMINTILGEFYE